MNQSNKQETIIFDPRNTEVLIRGRAERTIRTPFSAISSLTNRKRKRKTMQKDIFDLLDQVSKGAFSVFNNLKFNRSEEDNLTAYVGEEMNKTDKESLSRRLKELKDVGLIRRVKKELHGKGAKVYTFKDPRNTFIINPDMIRCHNHNEAEALWSQCAKKESTNGTTTHAAKSE
jgi:predicted transcriptional regulator